MLSSLRQIFSSQEYLNSGAKPLSSNAPHLPDTTDVEVDNDRCNNQVISHNIESSIDSSEDLLAAVAVSADIVHAYTAAQQQMFSTALPLLHSTHREFTWREARMSPVAVPAHVVHGYTPPKAQTKWKVNLLHDLPPELLALVFEILVGDPTRQAAIKYRLSKPVEDMKAHFSHSWSLECVSRVSRYCRAVAWPLLIGTVSVVTIKDFATIQRLPEKHRKLIRHMAVSIAALELLYMYICVVLPTDGTPNPLAIERLADAGVPDARVEKDQKVVAHPLTGLNLRRLTVFRPLTVNHLRTSDHLLGFNSFFDRAVTRIMLDSVSSLEEIVIRDPDTDWLAEPRVVDPAWSSSSFTKLRHVTAEIKHAIPILQTAGFPGLLSFTVGAGTSARDLASGLVSRSLHALRSRQTIPNLPTTLTLLHLLPRHGLPSEDIQSLLRALENLQNLRDFRVSFLQDVIIDISLSQDRTTTFKTQLASLIEALPPGLQVLEFRDPHKIWPGQREPLGQVFATAFDAAAAASPSTNVVIERIQRLSQLVILSLVLQEQRQGGRPCRTEPAIHRDVLPSPADWRHGWHQLCAQHLFDRMPALREVHLHCVADVGVFDLDHQDMHARAMAFECVWGRETNVRPSQPRADGGSNMKWLDIGARTLLWETAAW
ncbi:hypothetical protein BKA62DRAFT_680546 [Auriculariales sp. MPI-PUGE-AT-0066]|nr:hypothetical protein BKA62DRAFT_680546 [Auriculariales sp. MPI-PUGE-AT-0066]